MSAVAQNQHVAVWLNKRLKVAAASASYNVLTFSLFVRLLLQLFYYFSKDKTFSELRKRHQSSCPASCSSSSSFFTPSPCLREPQKTRWQPAEQLLYGLLIACRGSRLQQLECWRGQRSRTPFYAAAFISASASDAGKTGERWQWWEPSRMKTGRQTFAYGVKLLILCA